MTKKRNAPIADAPARALALLDELVGADILDEGTIRELSPDTWAEIEAVRDGLRAGRPGTKALFREAAAQPWAAKPWMRSLLRWCAANGEEGADPMETASFAWFNRARSVPEHAEDVFLAFVAGLRTAAQAFGVDR